AFGLAAGYGDGVDVVITGDSQKERAACVAWVNQLARRFGASPLGRTSGLAGFLGTIDTLSQRYYQEVYASEDAASLGRIHNDVVREPVFFSMAHPVIRGDGLEFTRPRRQPGRRGALFLFCARYG
ncbi:MAG TPA: hypothetical protein VIY86_08175, partial [Pirellulaceae bacterium]